jgi:hypothetical protein
MQRIQRTANTAWHPGATMLSFESIPPKEIVCRRPSMSTTPETRPLMTSWLRGRRRVRRITPLAVVGCTVLFFYCSIDLGADARSPQGVLDRFLAASAQRRPVPYRAVRRLEATSAKLNANGWVEALTEFDPESGLRVRILNEGGAGRIRGALRGVLDGEREATMPGKSSNAALTAENYSFQTGPVDADGLVALRVTPKRRDPALVEGTIFVTAANAELVRVEGRLAKSPSFWTRSVDVVRHYGQRGGRQVPVEVLSLADVKVIGPTQFVMKYEYESVNGQGANDVAPTLLARATSSR